MKNLFFLTVASIAYITTQMSNLWADDCQTALKKLSLEKQEIVGQQTQEILSADNSSYLLSLLKNAEIATKIRCGQIQEQKPYSFCDNINYKLETVLNDSDFETMTADEKAFLNQLKDNAEKAISNVCIQ